MFVKACVFSCDEGFFKPWGYLVDGYDESVISVSGADFCFSVTGVDDGASWHLGDLVHGVFGRV